MARDSVYISRVVQAQGKIYAALLELFPDDEVPQFMGQHRRGFPYVMSNNMASLADFLAEKAVEKIKANDEPEQESTEEEFNLYSLSRDELLELAEQRGVEVTPTGANNRVTVNDLIKALGEYDDTGTIGVGETPTE